MNWGTKIILALALFMTLIVSFGVYMVSHDTDSLVAEDYYERGLNYDRLQQEESQRRVDSQQRVDSLQRRDSLYAVDDIL